MNDLTRWMALLIATSAATRARPISADYQVTGPPAHRSEAVVAPGSSAIPRGTEPAKGLDRPGPADPRGPGPLSLAPAPHLGPLAGSVEAEITRAGAVEPAHPAGEAVASAPRKVELTEGPVDPGLDVVSSEWVMVGVKRPTGKKRRPVYLVDLPEETVYIVAVSVALIGAAIYLVRMVDRAGRSGRSGRPESRKRRGKGRDSAPEFPLVILGSGRSIRRLTFSGQ